jgi:hypothetical protein
VSNRDKDTLQIDIFRAFILDVFNAHAGNTAVVSQYFLENAVPLTFPSFSFWNKRSWSIFSERNSSRRCTRVTWEAMFAR